MIEASATGLSLQPVSPSLTDPLLPTCESLHEIVAADAVAWRPSESRSFHNRGSSRIIAAEFPAFARGSDASFRRKKFDKTASSLGRIAREMFFPCSKLHRLSKATHPVWVC